MDEGLEKSLPELHAHGLHCENLPHQAVVHRGCFPQACTVQGRGRDFRMHGSQQFVFAHHVILDVSDSGQIQGARKSSPLPWRPVRPCPST
eukprot:1474494-Pyramimonas_sp.AAC.1